MLMNRSRVPDLVDKACHIAGAIFEMAGKKNGYQLAREVLRNGKAERKMRQIIGLQGGNPEIGLDDFQIGQEKIDIKAKKSGQVLSMDNVALIEIARAAGAPRDKGAGIYFVKRIGDKVRVGDTIYTIHAEKSRKISRAIETLSALEPVKIGENYEMFIHKIKESSIIKRSFVMER